MRRADIALLVAVLSAAFTAGGLIWQLLLYRLSGHRLLIRLVPVVLDSMNTIVRGPERGFKADAPSEITKTLDPWTMDLSQVTVTNIGRLPVSVSEIALDVRTRPRRESRKRHTVRGDPLQVDGASTEDTIRIEAGESVHVLFDVWALVNGIRKRGAKTVIVRGSARAAGRRARRSPWQRRWVLDENQESLRDSGALGPAQRAFRALWRSLAFDPGTIQDLPLAWMVVQAGLEQGTNVEDLAANLGRVLEGDQRPRARAILKAFRSSPAGVVATGPNRD